MNLVDASAWLAWFADEPNAEQFAEPITSTKHAIILTTAARRSATLWTQDNDFAAISVTVAGVKYFRKSTRD